MIMGWSSLSFVLALEPAFALFLSGTQHASHLNFAGLGSFTTLREAERFGEDRTRKYQCPGQFTAPKITKNLSELTFIHIPRCAGTSIEDCTIGQKVGWGHENPKLHGLYTFQRGRQCYKHHVPPSHMPELYQGKETFCVVRNPYERMISEFHFPLVKGFAEYSKTGRCNAEGLNNFTIESLRLMKKLPYVHDCHLLPQSMFVYGLNSKKMQVDLNRKHCKHVLRQENLVRDFNTLMDDHGYGYRLTGVSSEGTSTDLDYWKCTRVTPKDFNKEALEMINEVYYNDFQLLNYNMIKK